MREKPLAENHGGNHCMNFLKNILKKKNPEEKKLLNNLA